jgi:hypothetical protein
MAIYSRDATFNRRWRINIFALDFALNAAVHGTFAFSLGGTLANWPLRCVHTRLAFAIKAQHSHRETNAPFESEPAGCFAS